MTYRTLPTTDPGKRWVETDEGHDVGMIRRGPDGYTATHPHAMFTAYNEPTFDAAFRALQHVNESHRAGNRRLRASFRITANEALYLIETDTELVVQRWDGAHGEDLARFEHPGRSSAFYDALEAALDALKATGRDLLDERLE